MKKLLAVAILLIFLFLLGGRIVLYEALTVENRNTMMESIHNGSISAKEVILCIDKHDAEALIDGNEITFKDHRYDITGTEIKGNKVIIHAVNDAEEESLMSGFNDAYVNSNHQNPLHRTALNLLDDFFKEYTSGKNINIDPQWALKQTYNYSPNLSVSDGFKGQVIPPPKIKSA